MKSNYKKVDGHGHILPEPHQIPQSIRKLGYFNIIEKGNKQFMTQDFLPGGWSRPISDPTFFVGPRLEWMAKHNIVHTVLITLSQFYCNEVADDKAAIDLMKFQNDFHQELIEKYPKQFTCGFVGIARLLDETLEEISKRSLSGLAFLCLPAHYKRKDGRYISSTDEACQEIFSCANDFKCPIHIHPYDYEFIFNLADIDKDWSGHKAPMPALTAHFFDRLISQGLHQTYSDVRFCLSHGNSVGVATIGRQDQAWLGRPDLRGPGSSIPHEALEAKNIFVDTIVHDPDMIQLLKKKMGTWRIIHGIDSPYPLGDGVTYLGDGAYPGITLDLAEDQGYIDAEQKRRIFQDNVFDWLYGEKKAKQEKALVFA